MPVTGGIIAGASALGKGIFGAFQNHEANQIDKNNPRPVESVDPIYQQNADLAQHLADQGIPQEEINRQMDAINQHQAGAISTLNNSANPGANLAGVVRAGNSATQSLNAEQAAARNKATMSLIQQKGILAGAKQRAWDYNSADKYSEGLAKSQALRGAGIQNISGGLDQVGKAGISMLGNPSYKIPTFGTPSTSFPTGFGTGGDE